jgi:hypothetical protein
VGLLEKLPTRGNAFKGVGKQSTDYVFVLNITESNGYHKLFDVIFSDLFGIRVKFREPFLWVFG